MNRMKSNYFSFISAIQTFDSIMNFIIYLAGNSYPLKWTYHVIMYFFSVLFIVVNGQGINDTEVVAPQKRCLGSWLFPLVCQLYIGTAIHAALAQNKTMKANADDVPTTNNLNITQNLPPLVNYANESSQVVPGITGDINVCGSNGCSVNATSATIRKNSPKKSKQSVRGTSGTNKCGNKMPASQYGCPIGYRSDMNGCCDSR